MILTNAHVVGRSTQARVRPFAFTRGKPVKLAPVSARVVYCSQEQDIALLQAHEMPRTAKALPVAAADPPAGETVYAIGNPGLAGGVLEQSISEGIISSSDRRLGGRRYLQHTAAVNPGNSGGPLLNVYGQVVGMITLKADLENVGFAVPAEEIRKAFATR
jgi:S1-C subfamily serine protease